MPLAINFEMVHSASKPILTVFNGRVFSLLPKSMSQIFLLFSMTSAFTINQSNSCNSSLNHFTKMLSLDPGSISLVDC